MEIPFCEGVPSFLYIFDTSFAPTLLFYAYIPVICIALFIGIFILVKDKFSLPSKVIFGISLIFSLWSFNIIGQWLTPISYLNYFFWQLTPFLEIFIPILLVYFLYLFLWKEDVKSTYKILTLLILSPVFVLLPTSLNMGAFSPEICEPVVGPLSLYVYGIEILSILLVLFLGTKKYLQKDNTIPRPQIILVTISSALFLLVFSVAQIFGELTKIYEIDVISPIGMVLFVIALAYMIVRFHSFNAKIISAQALVATLAVLVFAMLFVRKIENVRYVIIVTLGIVVAVGIALIKSVKREVSLREQLEIMNKQQVETMRFITHEVKGYLTDSSGAFDALLTDTFGPINDETRAMVKEALAKDQKAINEIKEFLRISDFKTGKVAYQIQPFDFKKTLEDALPMLEENAKKKGLTLSSHIAPGDYQISGDADQLTNHLIGNLINNATNYTPSGSITVSLSRSGKRIIFSVKDTGIGLTPEDMQVLFTEGGRGEESRNINPHSTGYGLFIAKKIVEAHGGRIWAESEGRGKGSTFFVDLPALS